MSARTPERETLSSGVERFGIGNLDSPLHVRQFQFRVFLGSPLFPSAVLTSHLECALNSQPSTRAPPRAREKPGPKQAKRCQKVPKRPSTPGALRRTDCDI